MKLQHLTDQTLHKDTLKLVANERETTTQILHHLKENDRRKLYSDFKCSSLFDYCVRMLGYSEASAQRRIVAARMMNDIPSLTDKIEQGVLSLTNISQANQFFRENQIKTIEDKKDLLKEIENLSKRDCEKKLFEISGKEFKINEGKRRISRNTNEVTLVLSDETIAEVEKLKSFLGKEHSIDEVIRYMAVAAIEKVEKKKFKQTERPRTLSPAKVDKAPSASQNREVYKRDKKCVQCGSLHDLNYDHREPYALGGKTDNANLRLLCFHCNQRSRIKVFGTRVPVLQKKAAPLHPG